MNTHTHKSQGSEFLADLQSLTLAPGQNLFEEPHEKAAFSTMIVRIRSEDQQVHQPDDLCQFQMPRRDVLKQSSEDVKCNDLLHVRLSYACSDCGPNADSDAAQSLRACQRCVSQLMDSSFEGVERGLR